MQVTIIGAGPGISHAVATLFGSKGYSVGLIARKEEKLQAEVKELESLGIQATYAVGDAGSEASLTAALDATAGQLGEADMILFNAYAPVFKPLERETWESVKQQFDINVGGAFFLLKKMLPLYKQQNKGKLFFTGGGLSLYPQATLAGLSIGKAALRNLVIGTAQGLKSTNIHLATVTVLGFVKKEDPKYNPDAIAALYWDLFSEQGQFTTEIKF